MLKRTNLYFGLLLFIIFLGTGVYMRFYFYPEHATDLLERMQIRSNHIYLLLISLLNVLAFKFSLINENKSGSYLDSIFRVLLIASGILSFCAFVYEHEGNMDARPITFFAVLFALLAIGVILINEVITLKRTKKSIDN